MATAGQEYRRVPAPARRALDPPAGDLPKLPRPRLQLTMPLTRDAKVSRTQNPGASIDDRRTQRALMRIDPDHIARMIGRHQQARRSRTTLLDTPHPDLTSSEYVVGGPADNIPVDAPQGERSYQVRPILEGKNRGRHFVRKTPSPESIAFGVRPRFAFDPTRTVAHAGQPNSTPGSHSRSTLGMALGSAEW